ncbi:TetR/AcrR family transcriptional regulator [Luteibaculum oceani]|uniref:TetR/AcrR family transcriptional regulator n=1 Tax=Luteibaculum oceani TaxID=1294296 RepID=A0A5C6V168_9FLAO|nr:TetR/AcrR family transcriptional regulator [Luteibaculum oceani]TXC77028.1 TetR/AcrR family transcriptional regulator [Luteibaculum oceani]
MGRKPIAKKRSRNEVKREKWINECIVHFEKTGIRNITMDDVAQLLNISKATIYNHFKSKDEMVQTAVAMLLNRIRKYEEYLTDQSIPFIKRYYMAMKYYAEQLTSVSPRLVRDVRETYPEMWDYVEMFRNQFSFVIGKYYEEGIAKGYFKDFDVNVMVGTDRWFLDALLTTTYLKDNNLTLDKAFDEYFKIKFDGIIHTVIADCKM